MVGVWTTARAATNVDLREATNRLKVPGNSCKSGGNTKAGPSSQ